MSPNSLVQLPFHEHGMIPRELSENCSLSCSICLLPLKGSSAYHCPSCEGLFLIHKLCAGFPPEIQHPSHPQHSLRLGAFTWSEICNGCRGGLDGVPYSCPACDEVAMHVRCAAVTLPPEEECEKDAEEIYFIGHEHPLTSFHVNLPNKIQCKVCREPISGQVYGCRACVFLLHESCSKIPTEILGHPCHPQHAMTLQADEVSIKECDVCKACFLFDPYKYHCKECSFIIDLNCAVNVSHPPLNDQRTEELDNRVFHHYSHPHKMLYLCSRLKLHIICGLCDQQISGYFYFCIDCNYAIHKMCADTPQEIVHPLHPDHPLVFKAVEPLVHEQAPGCSICGFYCDSGTFNFNCEKCSFTIGTRCAFAALKEGAALTIQSFHEHPMKLFYRSYSIQYFCLICKGVIEDLGYNCEEGCEIYLHMTCAKLSSELKHPFHPQHPLVLLPLPPKESVPCSACLQQLSGFTYYCAHCEFQMHATCAMRKRSAKHPRHEHNLTYFEKMGTTQCNICCSDCNIDMYRCVPCNYNLHWDCMPLPKSVKHKLHIHPMELCHKFIIDYFREQYCDLCETVRHPDHGVYHCEECICSSHIDCVIPKTNSEGSKLAQTLKLVKLDDEIVALEAKKDQMKKDLDVLMEVLEGLRKDRQEIQNNSTQPEPETKVDELEYCSSPRVNWDNYEKQLP